MKQIHVMMAAPAEILDENPLKIETFERSLIFRHN
tara:strand:- start:854 stop:958 length:105 start_codon:yes stop_codon:yes gene_type:complete